MTRNARVPVPQLTRAPSVRRETRAHVHAASAQAHSRSPRHRRRAGPRRRPAPGRRRADSASRTAGQLFSLQARWQRRSQSEAQVRADLARKESAIIAHTAALDARHAALDQRERDLTVEAERLAELHAGLDALYAHIYAGSSGASPAERTEKSVGDAPK